MLALLAVEQVQILALAEWVRQQVLAQLAVQLCKLELLELCIQALAQAWLQALEQE